MQEAVEKGMEQRLDQQVARQSQCFHDQLPTQSNTRIVVEGDHVHTLRAM
jgi:hypothetical protein